MRKTMLLMWGAALLALALPLQALAADPAPAPAAADAQPMTANLENIGLKDFLKFVATYTGRNIVFREDQVPNVQMSFFSREAINEPELMAILRHTLRNNGLDLVGKGDILYVQSTNQVANIDDTLYLAPGKGQADEITTTVVQLPPDVSASKVAAMLQGFSTPNLGKVTPVPESRAVIIRDRRARVTDMVSLLQNFREIRPKWDFEVFLLEKVKADEALAVLRDFFTQMMERGQQGEIPILQAVKWSNSLLAAGTPQQIGAVRNLLARLKSDGAGADKYKVIKLQNAKAASVYAVLQALGARYAYQAGGSDAGLGRGSYSGATGIGTASASPAPISSSSSSSGSSSSSSGFSSSSSTPGGVVAGSAMGTANEAFSLSVDPATNTIVVMGDPEFLAQVDEIVQRLDLAQDQVFVEGLIMEVSLDDVENFGVEWLAGVGSDNYHTSVGFMDSSTSGLIKYQEPIVKNSGAPDFSQMAGGFSVGAMGNVITYAGQRFPTLSTLISFVKNAEGVNILSTPQILTIDNSEAEIFIGENRAFKTGEKSASTGTEIISTYEYKDVGIKLKVIPHINQREGLIRMDLNQEVKSISGTDASLNPTTLSRTAKTVVQMVDGTTMVIGGLVEDTLNRTQRSVPGLRDLPLLGWLFKKRGENAQKRTLMFFITARIVHTMEDMKRLGKAKLDETQKKAREVQDAIDREFGIKKDQSPDSGAGTPKPGPNAAPERILPPEPVPGAVKPSPLED